MLKIKPKSKFMLSIGEEGAILLYFQNNTLNKRYFIKSKNSSVISDLRSCLADDRKAPLYLVLNHADQNYMLHSIPDVNRISAYLLAKTKVEHFANQYDINSALLIEKPGKYNSNWWYLLVLSKTQSMIRYWLDMLVDIGSNFKGILMLPIEMGNIAKKILHENPNHWKIMVASTKTSGYRQIVMKDEKIVFTRLIPFTGDNLPGIIAGGIYQEVKNTVQSLTKFGFKRDDPIDLCLIVQEDVKDSLSVINFSENSVSILTPYELNELLKLELAISEKDKFCDTVILFHSFKNKPTAVFHTKETKEFYLFNFLYINSPSFFLFLTLGLIMANVFYLSNLSSNVRITGDLKMKEHLLDGQLTQLTKNNNTKKMDDNFSFINVNNVLSKIEYSPLTQIRYVEKLKISDVELQSFEWSYDELKNSITTELKFHLQSDTSVSDRYGELKKSLNNNFRTQTVYISDLAISFPSEKQHVVVDVKIKEMI
ncbi:MAG: hypothetical protein QWI36_04910 [Wolbachia endosymbiont of Tyrophagus putrescentiae]|nr:hypothetical protein [Wolbachia endosymbiont of Tyrophagus putrescentiae]